MDFHCMVCDNSTHQAVKSCTFIVTALLPYLPIVMAMAGGVLPVRCSRSTTTLSSRERENLWKEGGGKGEGKEQHSYRNLAQSFAGGPLPLNIKAPQVSTHIPTPHIHML